jgi:hypothetical protein
LRRGLPGLLPVSLRDSLPDWLHVQRPGSSFGGPASVMQRAVMTQSRTQIQTHRQARGNRAAAAARPVMPESRHAARGFSPFTNLNATRMSRAALRFDTGHSL